MSEDPGAEMKKLAEILERNRKGQRTGADDKALEQMGRDASKRRQESGDLPETTH